MCEGGVDAVREGGVGVEALFGGVGVGVEPLHEGKVEACALVEELGRVQMEIGEGREEEGPGWDERCRRVGVGRCGRR